MYTWSKFDSLEFQLRDGAEQFWEDGYDYSDPDFWASYDPKPEPAFIQAVQMYDWLMKNDPR